MAKYHPHKEISQAIKYAISKGWRFDLGGSHAHGKLYCPHNDREGCHFSVWSTPQNPGNFARHIRRQIDKCPHCGPEGER